MIIENEKQIIKAIRYFPPLFIIIMSLFILLLMFIDKNNTLKKEKIKIQNEYIIKNKELIKNRVDEIYTYIENEKSLTESELKNSLQIAINNAYSIANTIYKENINVDKNLLKKLVIDALRNVRYYVALAQEKISKIY